jgi:hypothetical protein
MKTRQARKAAAREGLRRDPLHNRGFVPIMNELHKSGMNHEARRAAQTGWGTSPKGGVAWRKKQWIWGMIHHPRQADRRCFKITGRYLGELAEVVSTYFGEGKKASLINRLLAKLDF